MKKIIYITNYEVPYKTKFFNQLAKECNLEVIFETTTETDRNEKWTKSVENNYQHKYLFQNSKNRIISFKLLKYLLKQKDSIIIFGCYNSMIEASAIFFMKLLRKKYIINIEGEYFFDKKKSIIKRVILSGAQHYFVAGEIATDNFKNIMNVNNVSTYHFTSLTREEIKENSKNANDEKSEKNSILIVGRFQQYKGLDIVLKVAQMDQKNIYCFVGVEKELEEFNKEVANLNISNIQIIPFLQKDELIKKYKECSMFVLPSRNECWGLVINEAASCGIPIVSTYGSGAAVEFLRKEYPQYLSKVNNAEELYKSIKLLQQSNDKEEYRRYLLEKSKEFSIENMVKEHIEAIKSIFK